MTSNALNPQNRENLGRQLQGLQQSGFEVGEIQDVYDTLKAMCPEIGGKQYQQQNPKPETMKTQNPKP